MNKQISTRIGGITGMLILAFTLIMSIITLPQMAIIFTLRFAILFAGVFISCLLLYKHYTDIKFLDAFIHCVKSSITAIIIVIVGNSVLYLIFAKNKTFSNYTFDLMINIFTYSISGLLSSIVTSLIFNTFTKNK